MTVEIHWPHPLAAIDLETTGIDPATGEITEIGVVLCDEHLRPTETHRIRVATRLTDRGEAAPWVRENTAWGRSTQAEWLARGAVNRELALTQLGALIEGRALVAHYLPFERAWLEHNYRSMPQLSPIARWILGSDGEAWRRSIDTRELVSPLLAQGLIEGRGLAHICRYLGITLDHHDPVSDALACLGVASLLLRMG